jgi:putative transposase
VLRIYLNAWDRCYRGVSRRPKFKQRSRQMAVDVPQASQLNVVPVSRRWGEVSIPLVGRVRFRWTRDLPGVSRNCPGRITGARLKRNPIGWHISFRIEEPAPMVPPNPGAPVGIDWGVVHTIALSNGHDFNMPPLLSKGEQRRLRKLEVQAARRRAARHAGAGKPGKPMSRRERCSYEHIAKLRARQTRRRVDARIQVSRLRRRVDQDVGRLLIADLRRVWAGRGREPAEPRAVLLCGLRTCRASGHERGAGAVAAWTCRP